MEWMDGLLNHPSMDEDENLHRTVGRTDQDLYTTYGSKVRGEKNFWQDPSLALLSDFCFWAGDWRKRGFKPPRQLWR